MSMVALSMRMALMKLRKFTWNCWANRWDRWDSLMPRSWAAEEMVMF